MKQKVKVLGYEPKVSKNGKEYTVFGTDKGNMSCFETEEIEKLKACVNKEVELDIRQSGDFTNIDKVLFVEGNAQIPTPQPAMNSTTGEARMNKDKNIERMVMLKEVCAMFNAMYVVDQKTPKKLMENAIALVKQAREGLE
tara:strand:+ start:441 stop:863 length:423 start_codon:yes stop_codon:yes gene_type:complete